MPIQSPPWTDYMVCPVCTNEFAANLRAPITLGCGHSICKNCLTTLHRKQCPYDQTDISKNFDNLPINYALLQLTTSNIESLKSIDRELSPSIIKTFTPEDLKCYQIATKCIEELALLLKPSGSSSGLLSRPMQRKLVTLVQCQLLEAEGRARSLRAVRSLGERTVTELILQHQHQHQLSSNLWAAVRSRGCQFLGPAMQEETLKLVLLALEDGSPLSRKILVMYIVQKLEGAFPQASKTSIGHVVQLLYRASCFKVSKREGDSSLMTLKEEFRTYDALRREHDTQIVQIATEAGLRIAPDQWSSLLYGDTLHKSHMQSIIDKQQSPSSFAQSVDELILALQRTGDPAKLANLRNDLENLSKIDPSVELTANTSWDECAEALRSVREVVFGLVNFVQHHGKSKIQESYNQHTSRYKVSFCRELQTRGTCARGQNCSFAHSEEELERYRAKYKKNPMRTILQNNQMKENNNASASNGPIPKVNTTIANHHPNYLKGPPPPLHDPTRPNFKQISYRSENSLHHSSATAVHQIPQNNPNQHLRPSNVYASSNGGSSSSTPNLTQMQLSPNPSIPKSSSPQINSRFPFGNANGQHAGNIDPGHFMAPNCSIPPVHYNQQRPPLSAPPVAGYLANHKKPNSPYHSPMIPPPPSAARMHHSMNNGNGYYHSQNQIPPTSPMNNYRHGLDKFLPFYYQPPPLSPNMHGQIVKAPKSKSVTPCALDQVPIDFFMGRSETDEVDGAWGPPCPPSQLPQLLQSEVSDFLQNNRSVAKNKEKFIRSDSILENSKLDETFENLTVSGQFGAIGGLNKSPDTSQNQQQHQQQQQQWSGLQESLINEFGRASSSGGNNNNNLGGKRKNGDHPIPPSSLLAHPYGGINGNFLNINSSMISNPMTTNLTNDDDYWSIKDSSSSSTKDLDIGALGNGMSVLNLLDLINE